MSREVQRHALWTDVASIVVGDPCRLMPEAAWHEVIKQRCTRVDRNRDPQSPLLLPDYGILVPTVENCDGWCHVKIEHDKDGWPKRLTIDLSAKSKGI